MDSDTGREWYLAKWLALPTTIMDCAGNLKLGGNVGQGQKHKRAIFSVCGPNGDLVHQNT